MDKVRNWMYSAATNFVTFLKTLTWKSWVKFAILLAFVATIIVMTIFFDVQSNLISFMEFVQSQGILGLFIFFVAFTIATIVFVPGMKMAAGFLFGMGTGILIAQITSISGACLAFLIGRYLARDWVESKMKNSVKLDALDKAIEQTGWKITLLLRLTVPFTLLNYMLSLTKIKFWQYAVSTFFGIIPNTIVWVYVGSLGRSFAEYSSGEDAINLIYLSVAGVVFVISFILVTFIVRRAVKKQLEEQKPLLNDQPEDEVQVGDVNKEVV